MPKRKHQNCVGGRRENVRLRCKFVKVAVMTMREQGACRWPGDTPAWGTQEAGRGGRGTTKHQEAVKCILVIRRGIGKDRMTELPSDRAHRQGWPKCSNLLPLMTEEINEIDLAVLHSTIKISGICAMGNATQPSSQTVTQIGVILPAVVQPNMITSTMIMEKYPRILNLVKNFHQGWIIKHEII